MQDMMWYLTMEGSCKCGLRCPFLIDKQFDFNPSVPSKFGFANHDEEPLANCHCTVYDTCFGKEEASDDELEKDSSPVLASEVFSTPKAATETKKAKPRGKVL